MRALQTAVVLLLLSSVSVGCARFRMTGEPPRDGEGKAEAPFNCTTKDCAEAQVQVYWLQNGTCETRTTFSDVRITPGALITWRLVDRGMTSPTGSFIFDQRIGVDIRNAGNTFEKYGYVDGDATTFRWRGGQKSADKREYVYHVLPRNGSAECANVDPFIWND